jgi:hypothetical protein
MVKPRTVTPISYEPRQPERARGRHVYCRIVELFAVLGLAMQIGLAVPYCRYSDSRYRQSVIWILDVWEIIGVLSATAALLWLVETRGARVVAWTVFVLNVIAAAVAWLLPHLNY